MQCNALYNYTNLGPIHFLTLSVVWLSVVRFPDPLGKSVRLRQQPPYWLLSYWPTTVNCYNLHLLTFILSTFSCRGIYIFQRYLWNGNGSFFSGIHVVGLTSVAINLPLASITPVITLWPPTTFQLFQSFFFLSLFLFHPRRLGPNIQLMLVAPRHLIFNYSWHNLLIKSLTYLLKWEVPGV